MSAPIAPTPKALAGVALLHGMPLDALRDLAPLLSHRRIEAGVTVFAEGEPGDSMLLLASGGAEVVRRLPGNLRQTLAHVGPGEALGELALLTRRPRSATVRAVAPSTAWQLDAHAFELLRRDGRPVAVELVRRIGDSALARLRHLYAVIAGALEDRTGARGPERHPRALPSTARPAAADDADDAYLAGTMLFRGLAPDAVAEVTNGARRVAVPRGTVLAAEGTRPDVLLVVVRGALESTIRRGGLVQRVRLAGPGRLACHLGVLDGGPSPVEVRARERSTVLELPRARVQSIVRSPERLHRDITSAIQIDVVRALQAGERPHGTMAAAVVRAAPLAA
jgi:CRP-like cAMP-binding protein